MTFDRRLHHAARELRSVPVDVPDLPGFAPVRRVARRIPSFAAPVLFVLGGLVAVSGVGAGGQPGHDNRFEGDFAVGAQQAEHAVAHGADAATTSERSVGPAVRNTPFAGQTIVPANPPRTGREFIDSIERELEMISSAGRRAVGDHATGTGLDRTPQAATVPL